jgi:hypothetical protein
MNVELLRRTTTKDQGYLLKKLFSIAAAVLTGAWAASASDAPPHNISAANLNVVQNDTGNTADSVTVTETLSINDLRLRIGSNRGDYNLQVGESATNDLAEGFPLVSISQNGRDNGELGDEQKNYAAPAFDGNASGYWAVIQDTTSDRAEFNINCAVAFFRYTNWLCGWSRNSTGANGSGTVTNDFFTGSPGLTMQNFNGVSSGRTHLDLRDFGVDSTLSGIILVNHGKNEGNYAVSQVNPDGTWEVYVRDNFGNGTAVEQDPAAFVFIPKTNTTVVSGKFGLDATGTNAVTLMYSGGSPAFSVTNFSVGRYRLTIPGGSPTAGVLIISPEATATTNSGFDNVISYEPDGDGWIIESRDTGVFPPVLEACTNQPVACFLYIPAATAGFTVTPTNTLVTSEFGLSANFTVELDLAPLNDVTIPVSSSNPLEGIVSTNSLTFNSTNWNIPQVVTVTGQDDAIVDGPVNYSIILGPAMSLDTNYDTLDPIDVQVINVDDEQPGITVTPTDGLTTTEAGGSGVFAVFLNQQPTADVTIGLSSGNTAEGTVSPSSLTFSPANWNVPQPVTATGVNDFRVDGDQPYTIATAPATSADANYNGVNPTDVSVVNLDDDVPAIIYNATLPLTVIEGQTTSYSVVLATQPDSNVVIQVKSSATAVGTVSPATLTFTPLDWSTPKVVTLTGVDNLVTNGTVSFNITNNVSSTDPLYVNFAGPRIFPAVSLDNESQLIFPSGDCIYGVGMPDIGLDGQAQIADADATTYDTGSLTFAIATNGTPEDRLTIRSAGTGANQIAVVDDTISYAGAQIGTFTGGSNLTTLTVSLGANSTLPAVQQLIRSITFGTTTNNPSLATRSVSVVLNDGRGAVASALKLVRVGALRLLQYQEGGDYGYGNYTGAADIALSQVGHGTAYPEGRTKAPTEGLLIDWPDGGTPNESQVLLRFDDFVGTNYWQVPSNAVIVSAELLLRVNNTGDGGRLFRMLMPWDATNDTWDSVGGGFLPDDIHARSVYESQVGVEDGSGATGTGIISVGVTPDVQAWVNGQTNFGWVMIGWPLRTDGTGFSPSEVKTVGDRPRLRVLWLVPGTSSTTSFRQGVNGYANTFDTNLRQATPDQNYATENIIWSDANDVGNTNNTQGLLRFDNIIGTDTNQIPPGAFIQSAVLELPCLGPDAMGDGGRIYAMLQPWTDTAVTWSTFGANGIQPDGIVAATTPTVVAGNASRDPDVQATINTYEVTADVQAWVNGSRVNYGWAILPWATGNNGWGFRSSEWSNFVYPDEPERERPRLRVFYTLNNDVVGAPTLHSVTMSQDHIDVPFRGTVGKIYSVMRAPGATGPWLNIGSATVDSNGNASFRDNTPLPGQGFYRIVYP